MSSRPTDAGGSRRLLARQALVALGICLAAGCRADSLTMPQEPVSCGDAPGCRPTQSTPVNAVVFVDLDDALQRLVPTVDDAAARTALADALRGLDEKLRANQSPEARVRLALIYMQLDRLRVTLPGDAPVELPDMAALRLELAPVANALGVGTTP